MNHKLLCLILIFLLGMIFISTSAAEDSANAINNDALILDEINEDIAIGNNNDNNNIASSRNNDDTISDESSEAILSNNKKAQLTYADDSFEALNDLINNNNYEAINLTGDYKYYESDSDFIHGINLNRTLTINGNNHTINGSDTARIFNITGDYVNINNVNFISGNAYGNDNIDKCGGAIYCSGSYATIENSTFKNNKANEGGAIYWYAAKGSVSKSIFINNTASSGEGSSYYNGYSGDCRVQVQNNILLNNNGNNIYFQNPEKADANNNWFGNNASNWNEAPNTLSNAIKTWLYLNGTGELTNLSPFEHELVFKLYYYNDYSRKTYDYDNRLLPSLNLNINSTNGKINDSAKLNENIEFEPENIVSYVTAQVENVECTIYVKCPNGTNFWELNQTINNNSDSEIYISQNYTYDIYLDKHLKNGININRTLTIYGNNFTLDGSKTGRIFNVSGRNVIISNLTLINGSAEGPTYMDNRGGAIYWEGRNGTLINCTLKNNIGSYGGAVEWDGEKGKILYCTFENNTARVGGGAIYWEKADGIIGNCTLKNNKLPLKIIEEEEGTGLSWNYGIGGGAINWNGEYGIVENCTLENNIAGEGGAVKWFGIEGILANSILEGNNGILGGAIHWVGENGLIANNTIKNNLANEGNGIRLYQTSTSITGNILYDSIYWFDDTSGRINDNIIINYGPNWGISFINSEGINIDNNWWFGRNASDYAEPPYDLSETWLYLNGTADPNSIPALCTSEIVFDLYLYNGASGTIIKYDNSLLPKVNFTLSATKGNVSEMGCLGENNTYTALTNGTGTVTAKSEFGECTIELNIEPIAYITVETQEFDYTEEPTIQISYDNTAEGNLTLTLKGKNGHEYIFQNMDLNTMLLLPEPILPDEYNLTLEYSGDDVFNPQTVNASLIVNKLKTDIEIVPHNITIKDTNDLMFEISLPENLTGELSINMSGDISTVNVSKAGIKKDGKLIINLSNDNYPIGEYNLTARYLGDEIYGISEAKGVSNIIKFTPEINAKASNITFGEDEIINISIDATGDVKIIIDGKNYSETLEDGKASITIAGLTGGEKTAIIYYLGDGNNTENEITLSFTVNKASTTLNTTDLTTLYADDNKLLITLKDSEGNPLNGALVSVELNGKITNYTTADGQIKVPTKDLDANKYGVNIKFAGDDNYNESSASAEITVEAANSTVKGEEINITYGEAINIPISSENATNVSYKITDEDGETVKEGTAEANGNISNLDLAAEEYTVELTAIVDKNHKPSSSTSKITINKAQSSINAKDVNVTYGEPAIIETTSENASEMTYQIKDKNNDIVSSGTIQANESIDLNNLAAGEYTAEISYSGNENYTGSNASAKLTISKLGTEINAADLNTTYKEENYLVATLKDSKGNPLGGVELSVDLDGNKTFVTDSNGQIRIPTKGLASDKYTASISYPGNENYANSNASAKVSVNRIKTRFNFSNMTTTAFEQKVDGRIGKYFYFQLLDEYGNPLAGKRVSIGFNGVVYNRTSNDTGWAKLQINLRCVNIYTFAVTFGGDDEYDGAFDVAAINVTPQTPKLSTSNKAYKASAKTKTLSTTLKSAKGNPVSGKKITFTVNGKKYTAKTNKKGVATVKVSLNKKGTYKFTAVFARDNTYKKVSKTGKLTIK